MDDDEEEACDEDAAHDGPRSSTGVKRARDTRGRGEGGEDGGPQRKRVAKDPGVNTQFLPDRCAHEAGRGHARHTEHPRCVVGTWSHAQHMAKGPIRWHSVPARWMGPQAAESYMHLAGGAP